MRIEGLLDGSETQFLIDSGAAIFVIHSSVILNGVSLNSQDGSTEIIAAKGQPLRIVGQVELSVSFATTDFNTQDKFLVANDLPVAGILGCDFLSTHAAIINYADRCLFLGNNSPIPILPSSEGVNVSCCCPLSLPADITIPPRMVKKISVMFSNKMSRPLMGMGLVEPLPTTAKHLAIARSLSTIQDNAVHIQVMNTGPLPIQLYRGTKLATFTPRDHVFVLEKGSAVNACLDTPASF